ncbi:MAG: chemotaxis protein CheW, partial [Planctomycetota bacterium]|nr:chemotaxis protein CheW [Planctomycetota bacterium]
CGFLDFGRLGDLAHAGETLLDRMRHGGVQCSPQICDQLLQLVDAVRASLTHIMEHGQESDDEHEALKQQLRDLASANRQPVSPDPASKDAGDFDGTMLHASSADWSDELTAAPLPESRSMETPTKGLVDKLVSPSAEFDQQIPDSSNTAQREAANEEITPTPPPTKSPSSPVATGKSSSPKTVTPKPVASKPVTPIPSTRDSSLSHASGLSSSNIRVDVDLLDELMNLVGELVLTRNQIVQRMAPHSDAAFLAHAQRLNGITSELQDRFIKTRMQRIGIVWQRFPRVIREVARQCGKRVRLEMDGEDAELDRTLLEAIVDPLMHIVRNAIDHGIEEPAVRRSVGKPELGTIRLRAYHEGGQVNVEVSDDGAGLDPERIRRKAVEKQLIDEDESVMLSHSELLQSVFRAGFSTADAITNVSGRGVGMDVVKTNIERIGGTVQLESTLGTGTTVRMKVPLTLAIIPALIVNSRGHRFAIPQVNVLELFSLNPGDARTKVERVQNALVYRLRGKLIPLIELHELLELPAAECIATDSSRSRSRSREQRGVDVVVLQVHDRRLGLIVDEVQNNEEIVVKPLSRLIQDVPAFAGATILGDGRVSLILDGAGIARMTDVFATQAQTMAHNDDDDAASGQFDFADGLLVCSLRTDERRGSRRIAIALGDVRHIRQFPTAELTRAANELAVQYEGRILPLCDVATKFFGAQPVEPDDEFLRVVIHGDDSSTMGLIVDRVLDIAATPREVRPSDQPHILGSAIIDGHITDIVDPSVLIQEVRQTHSPATHPEPASTDR